MSDKKKIKDLLERELGSLVSQTDDYGVLDNIPMDERVKMSKWDLVVKQLVNKAINGDNKAMQEILDRMFGKPPLEIKQDVNVTNYTTFLENLGRLRA